MKSRQARALHLNSTFTKICQRLLKGPQEARTDLCIPFENLSTLICCTVRYQTCIQRKQRQIHTLLVETCRCLFVNCKIIIRLVISFSCQPSICHSHLRRLRAKLSLFIYKTLMCTSSLRCKKNCICFHPIKMIASYNPADFIKGNL